MSDGTGHAGTVPMDTVRQGATESALNPYSHSVNKWTFLQFLVRFGFRFHLCLQISRVLCCPWNCRRDTLCSSSGRSASPQLTLTLGSTQGFQAAFCLTAGHSLCIVFQWYRVQFGIPVRDNRTPPALSRLYHTLPWWKTAVEHRAYDARIWHQMIERC